MVSKHILGYCPIYFLGWFFFWNCALEASKSFQGLSEENDSKSWYTLLQHPKERERETSIHKNYNLSPTPSFLVAALVIFQGVSITLPNIIVFIRVQKRLTSRRLVKKSYPDEVGFWTVMRDFPRAPMVKTPAIHTTPIRIPWSMGVVWEWRSHFWRAGISLDS